MKKSHCRERLKYVGKDDRVEEYVESLSLNSKLDCVHCQRKKAGVRGRGKC